MCVFAVSSAGSQLCSPKLQYYVTPGQYILSVFTGRVHSHHFATFDCDHNHVQHPSHDLLSASS